MAPEAFCGDVFSCSSDVWSLGVVIWEIYSLGLLPYHDLKTWQLEWYIVQNNHRLKSPNVCPPAL